MAIVVTAAELPSEEAREEKRKVQQAATTATWRSLTDILSIDKNIAWLDGIAFDQLIVRRHDDHVLAMIKGTKGRKAYIAFVAGLTYAETLETVAEFAAKGVLTWREDRYPSRRAKGS